MENKILNAVTVILFVIMLVLVYAVITCEPNTNMYIALFYDIVGIAACYHLQISNYIEMQEEED
jgi:general stress protein CsbA